MIPFLFLLSLAPQQGDSYSPDGLQWADLGFDRAVFQIADLKSAGSPAMRMNDDMADKAGVVPGPTPGYWISSSLIVETDDTYRLHELADGLTPIQVEDLTGAPGFKLVHTSSVGAALALCPTFDAYYGDDKVYLDAERPIRQRALPSDPGFSNQWHLHNTLLPIADANLEGAWNAGITGNGVTIGVVDGGVLTIHADLDDNYNAAASISGSASGHGTSCAGVAAAEGNNNEGGVGAAYGAQWSNLYYGSSSTIATNFGHRNDLNDIKTNSWGPYDDGTISYMTTAEYSALEDAVYNGRGGLGTVFCWAAGNGSTDDRVEYDPYASSRLTLAIGAIGDSDYRSWYNEKGSSMTVVAHSNGNNRGIYTTAYPGYTSSFGGTSSASPLGAGIVALLLEANPTLSWRDVTGVLIESARMCDGGNGNWAVNAAGHDVNINYGFGAIDATAAVQLAQSWTNLPAEMSTSSGVVAVNQSIPDNDTNGLTRTVNISQDMSIESVELKLNAAHTYVGDLHVTLTAPSGKISVLTHVRPDPTDDYNNFIFTSLRHWDESSQGDWTVRVSDRDPGTTGTWEDFTLTVYGNDPLPPTFTVSDPLVAAGAFVQFSTSNGTASTPTYLAYSLAGLGSFHVPQLGVTLGIASPQQLGSMAMSDASGAASFSMVVPGNAFGLNYWIQALQSGQVSNIVSGTVQ